MSEMPMTPFLMQVAVYLYQAHGADLSKFCLVFPGKRAGAFFTAYLNSLITSPMISPEIITIDELISSKSILQKSDQLTLLIHLHEVYLQVTGHPEPLDEFYFWGEILLADFDDIDKYLLNADDLFRNIADLKDLDNQFDYLSAEQKRAIEEFWGNLEKVPHSLNKEKFIGIWVRLASIFNGFKAQLRNKGIAFPGMIYRDVAENNHFDHEEKQIVFIGFNALNECEKSIFNQLQKLNKALFFWDFSANYLSDSDHEAGRFLRLNLAAFPPPKDFVMEEMPPTKNRKLTMISVPGNITQAQAINLPHVLSANQSDIPFDDTALVLADENLLVPVISAVGDRFTDINITMGYPLTNTPVYGFISQLISLQKNARKTTDSLSFYHKQVTALLNHQFVSDTETKLFIAEIYKKNKIYLTASELQINPYCSKLFSRPEGLEGLLNYLLELIAEISLKLDQSEDSSNAMEQEYFFQTFLVIQRLKDSLVGINLKEFPDKILFRLLDQSLRRISIPFEGEPLKGLQIMGLLETRCLDFNNLVIFSANEGFLPRLSANHSFIPYHLRKGFGMPTYEDRDAMYAYYFYRLIQRSENAVFVFNSITEGISTAERSRFLYQLMYDSDFNTEELNMKFSFKGIASEIINIASNEEHIRILTDTYSEKKLSPSAINTYLDCKLKFYFKYITKIKEIEEIKEEIDGALFGNIFHYVLEQIYRPYENKLLNASSLQSIIGNINYIQKLIHEAIAINYYKVDDHKAASKIKIQGQGILIATQMLDYISQVLKNDINYLPFKILGLEKDFSAEYEVSANDRKFLIRIGGIVDRLDQTTDGLRVVDYKTGRSLRIDFNDWDMLFNRDNKDRRKEILQALIYADVISRTVDSEHIYPVIYRIDDLFKEEFMPHIIFEKQVFQYQEFANEFRSVFSAVLSEIFSLENSYDQTKNVEKCKYCAYNKICRREAN